MGHKLLSCFVGLVLAFTLLGCQQECEVIVDKGECFDERIVGDGTGMDTGVELLLLPKNKLKYTVSILIPTFPPITAIECKDVTYGEKPDGTITADWSTCTGGSVMDVHRELGSIFTEFQQSQAQKNILQEKIQQLSPQMPKLAEDAMYWKGLLQVSPCGERGESQMCTFKASPGCCTAATQLMPLNISIGLPEDACDEEERYYYTHGAVCENKADQCLTVPEDAVAWEKECRSNLDAIGPFGVCVSLTGKPDKECMKDFFGKTWTPPCAETVAALMTCAVNQGMACLSAGCGMSEDSQNSESCRACGELQMIENCIPFFEYGSGLPHCPYVYNDESFLRRYQIFENISATGRPTATAGCLALMGFVVFGVALFRRFRGTRSVHASANEQLELLESE